ncbi:MAG: acyltransferase [Thiotrichales bacterium]
MTPKSSGRYKFDKYSSIINAITRLNKLLPRFVFSISWILLRPWAFKTAIALRYFIAKRLAKTCGDVVQFGPNVTVQCWEKLDIGSRVNIHENCYIDASGEVTIGSDVSIAHASSILSFNHTWSDRSVPIKYNPYSYRPVTISDDVWIGCGVRILAGSVIESRTIVAAGAVLTPGTYSCGIYGGIPAKMLKEMS